MRLAAAAVAGIAGLAVAGHQVTWSSHEQRPSALLEPRSAYSQEPVVVDVYEYGFQPATVVIRAGQAVAWKDLGKQFHVVTASTRAGRKVFRLARDFGSSSHVFTKPGRYPYHCALHPRMRGVVEVRGRT
jgi:plastocyanin